MRAVVLTGLKKMELHEVPAPVIHRDKDVLLKIAKVGVCGSDIHYFETGRIGARAVEFPFIAGHECAGTVLEVGRAVHRVRAGEAVAVDPAMSCHQCDQCLAGRQNTCRYLTFLGSAGEAPGCLSEYIVMPEDCLYPLAGRLTLEQAVLVEPLSIGIYAVKQSQLAQGSSIGILGAGPIGLSVLRAALIQGVDPVFMTDRLEYRVAVARKAGATWAGNPDREDVVGMIREQQPLGLAAVYECAGQQETLDQAVELLRPGGKLMLVGIPRTERVSFEIDSLRRKEITLINVHRQNQCIEPALDLIASAPAQFNFLVTHRSPPEQASAAFERVAGYRDGVMKAIIEFA